MSAPVGHTEDETATVPTMYAPPWAREEKRDDPGDAGMAAVERALNASEELRRTLPPAAPLTPAERRLRWRDKPFEGDIAVRSLRDRGSLEPVAVPMPPLPERSFPVGLLWRVAGAVGLAALAAFFVVGAMPQPVRAPQISAVQPSAQPSAPAPEPVAFTERVAPITAAVAAPAPPEQPAPALAAAAPPLPASPPAASATRPLDREEIAMLVRRSEELITQGDIAAARLMLTRAAEAGDARAALALGATYDGAMLRKLGVLGVAADAAQARAWYAKAAEYGSGEATKRLERTAETRR